MSELDWEEPPTLETPNVPLVRDWVGPAFEAWTRGCYPPRRGVTVVWGCLFVVPYLIWQFAKLWIYGLGVVALLLANLVWIVAECITYRHRRKRALLETWTTYMTDLHGEDQPPELA